MVTVGGSGVGADLLRRVIAAYPQAKRGAPDLRMIVVAGPRIDPDSLPYLDGLEVLPYVPDLYKHLAACDLAVVQGGLTTAMELTAGRRPFLYFPLKHHFEQRIHVAHRLDRYGAGRRMEYDDSPPDAIAEAIVASWAGRWTTGRSRPTARAAPPSTSRSCCHDRHDPRHAGGADAARAIPDQEGFVERDGVRTFYEAYGEGETTILLLPTWSLLHSRIWKAQIPYLSRHFRVVTFDGRGNGRSDRPSEPEAYAEPEFAADALAVMDATDTEQAVLVSLSRGAERSLHIGAGHPERVAGMVFIAPALPLAPTPPRRRAEQAFVTPRESYEGWEKWNRHYWLEHYEDFVDFFISQIFTEPHSTKQREDAIGWALETDPETLAATQLAPRLRDEDSVRELTARIRWPVLVVHGPTMPSGPTTRGRRSPR